MGQTDIMVDVIQSQLLTHAVFPCVPCGDLLSHGGDRQTDVKVDPLVEGSIALPAQWRQHVFNGRQSAEHHAVSHADQAPAPHGLDRLDVEQLWQRHPVRLGRWPFVLVAWRLHPGPIGGQQGRHIRAKPSVSNSRAQSGAKTCATWWTTRWAMARVRSLTSIARSRLRSCFIATQSPRGERSRRSLASAALLTLTLTALSRANHASRYTCRTCTSGRTCHVKSGSCAVASTHYCSTVFGSTSRTSAVPRMLASSATHVITRTMCSTETRLSWKGAPRVSARAYHRNRKFRVAPIPLILFSVNIANERSL